MDLETFTVLVHELLNKDTDIFSEEAPLFILDSKSAVCMANSGKDDNNTSHISKRVHFVRNGEKCKMRNIDKCEGGQQLTYIRTNNVGKNDLNHIIKYIMARLDNWYRTLVQEGWQDTGYSIVTSVMYD